MAIGAFRSAGRRLQATRAKEIDNGRPVALRTPTRLEGSVPVE
jgi:hypothetical protein